MNIRRLAAVFGLLGFAGLNVLSIGAILTAKKDAKLPPRFAKIGVYTTAEQQAEIIARLGGTGYVPAIGRFSSTYIVVLVGYQFDAELDRFFSTEVARLPGVTGCKMLRRDLAA